MPLLPLAAAKHNWLEQRQRPWGLHDGCWALEIHSAGCASTEYAAETFCWPLISCCGPLALELQGRLAKALQQLVQQLLEGLLFAVQCSADHADRLDTFSKGWQPSKETELTATDSPSVSFPRIQSGTLQVYLQLCPILNR